MAAPSLIGSGPLLPAPTELRATGSAVSHGGGWRPVFTAMAKAGGGSVASGLLSAVATKIIAVMLGPVYVGLLQTLQQVRQTALVVATSNGQTALVQGASALEGARRSEFLKTAAMVFAAGIILTAVTMTLAPARVAALAGMPGATASLMVWLSIPVILSGIFVFLAGLLNALGGVGRLAVLQVAASLAMAAAAWPAVQAVRSGHLVALVHMLTASAAVSVAAALVMLAPDRSRISSWFGDWFGQWDCLGQRAGIRSLASYWSPAGLRHFTGISGAMLASGLASSLALLLVRSRILRGDGLATAGQFDAAWGISMNHVALVLASLQTYYLPAFARAGTRAERTELTSRVLMVATLVAAPLIALLAFLKPVLLAVLYSPQFHPAAAYLRWTLLGDYLKITSWILSIPMIASADMRIFLTTDLTVYGVFVVSAVALGQWFPAAQSAAVAFVLMYAVHLAICAMYVRRRHGLFLRKRVWTVWLAGFALVLCASAISWSPGPR